VSADFQRVSAKSRLVDEVEALLAWVMG
jgi:hypothetical protein